MPAKRMNIERYLAIVATVVALISVMIAVWEGAEMRSHNRLSVKPMLIFNKTYTVTKTVDEPDQIVMTLSAVNSGMGPAIVSDLDLNIVGADGGKTPFENWNTALTAAGYSGLILITSDIGVGGVIEKGDETVLVSLEWNDGDYERLDFRMGYESIYEEEFNNSAPDLLDSTASTAATASAAADTHRTKTTRPTVRTPAHSPTAK